MGAPPEGWAGLFDVHTDLLLSQQSARDPEPAPAARAARQRFLERLPPGYAEKTAPEVAARDWLEISRLLALRPSPAAGDGGVGAAHMALSPGRAGAPGDFRLRRTALSRAELSSLLRAIESFGLVAEEAVPWHFALGSEGGDVFIDDVGLRVGTPVAAPGFELGAGGSRLVDALTAAIGTLTELSVLNRLVVGAGLSWREVNLLHAYCAYRQAVGGPRAAERADLMTQALVAFPAAAAVVVGLFRGLFGPGSGAAADGARSDLRAALAAVPDLQHDEALRELVALVEATTRTNWALERETISLKFASRSVPFSEQLMVRPR
ncbi:MAG: hypothetical protein ACLP7F_01645 [Acidimicrobiales bacterium]